MKAFMKTECPSGLSERGTCFQTGGRAGTFRLAFRTLEMKAPAGPGRDFMPLGCRKYGKEVCLSQHVQQNSGSDNYNADHCGHFGQELLIAAEKIGSKECSP
jgi:hypothetical protein